MIELAGQGVDSVFTSVSFSLGNNEVENLTAAVGTASISLTGSAHANTLTGNAGRNTLKGGAGNDKLYGEGGKDLLIGGSGADIFVFSSSAHSRMSSADTIEDFHRGSDHIDLRDMDANTRLAGNQVFTFIGNNVFQGKAGELRFANGVASGDTNGDKIADFGINVAGLSAMSRSDFYL